MPPSAAPATGSAPDTHEPAAVAARRPSPHLSIKVLRGPVESAEYTAGAFQAACTRLGVRQSMGRVGSALDNAVIESWHSTLEFELRRDARFITRAQARREVVEWIEHYNHDRRHSALGMRSPIAYEQALLERPPEQAA